MPNLLFAAEPDDWPEYEPHLRAALAQAGIEAHLSPEIAPEAVDYIIYAPSSPLKDFTPFTRAKAVLNLWAGVEAIVGNETLHLPLCRMVDPALTQGMVEWVTGHVLRHHLGMDRHILAQPGDWTRRVPPVSWDRRVTVLGLGELGSAAASMLARIGFAVTGWSRSPKKIEGIRCLAGEDQLAQAMDGAEIVVLLLPDTPATQNVINAASLAQLAMGAVILNPGRGPLIDDDALLAALKTGRIGHATLDVFREEPLPKDHPFWAHPNVTVTPHIAADTRAKWSSPVIVENIRRGEAGLPFLHLVDRSLGY